MAKDNLIYILHMLECIQTINEYVDDREQFYSTRIVQDAVIRNLQIMSESSQRLSQVVKDSYPAVPWREISGFRNILVHDYLGLDLDVIWSVIEQELPDLESTLTSIKINLE